VIGRYPLIGFNSYPILFEFCKYQVDICNQAAPFFPIFVPQNLKWKNMKLSNNKILITGGASGIGLGLTERFIKENNTVIICGRRESVLKEVSDKFPTVITRVCDLLVEAERTALFKWVSEQHSDVNVLINNAGIQQWMTISDDGFFQRAKDEIATNIEAPLHLTSLFINLQSLTTVINVTSAWLLCRLQKCRFTALPKLFFTPFHSRRATC
jgi:uncharacterized oxidoreductase